MHYNLSELLEQKTFDELSENERAFVLNEMSETDYRQQHEVIVSTQFFLTDEAAQLKPNPGIKAAALGALGKKKKPILPIFIHHRIPTWMAVAACLLVFFLIFDFDPNLNEEIYAETETDTVYVDKYITQTEYVNRPGDTVFQVIYKYIEPEEQQETVETHQPNEALNTYTAEMLQVENLNYTQLINDGTGSRGISMSNDSLTEIMSSYAY